MLVNLLLTVIFVFTLAARDAQADDTAPLEVGGFKLGTDITDYHDIEYTNYLKELVVNDWHGFRKGIISYGTCAHPGEIVRIQMKYDDSSPEFYQKVLREYEHKFGKPGEWKGDAFGVLYVWKWTFTDKDNNPVNLILQHNLHNHNENIGTVVKLYYPEREEEEHLCFLKHCEINKTPAERERIEQRKHADWDFLIPR